MKAFDTNILVYAHLEANINFPVASAMLKNVAEGSLPWALPWPCIYEFLRVMTHPVATERPLPSEEAWERVENLLGSPSLVLLSETERHPSVLHSLIRKTRISGNLVFDAHIAALLIEHGVREIVTADEDFRRFEELKVMNPFRGVA